MTKVITQKEESHFICDCCEKNYEIEAVNIEFWYGSFNDEVSLHFCSDKCFYIYVTTKYKEELDKQ